MAGTVISVILCDTAETSMQIELYAADVPYVGLGVEGLLTFVPFRHTFEFFTKSPDHDVWSFDDMDEDEFTPEMRRVNEWEWILALDRAYKHGTMISCANETIHGNRFSIHSKKNYRGGGFRNNLHFNVSTDVGENGPRYFELMSDTVRHVAERFPDRCTRQTNVNIVPDGRVCVYTMNCLKYTHIKD